MADDEKAHQKRLKEARKVLEKSYKLYQDGKIDQDELKERLKPYKTELVEMGLAKGSKTEAAPAQKSSETKVEDEKAYAVPAVADRPEIPDAVRAKPWSRRSTLTLDEIKRKVDQMGSSGPSEGLRETYKQRYGEDLAPPPDNVTFQVTTPPPQEAPAPDPRPEPAAEQAPISDRSKGFLKNLFTKKNT